MVGPSAVTSIRTGGHLKGLALAVSEKGGQRLGVGAARRGAVASLPSWQAGGNMGWRTPQVNRACLGSAWGTDLWYEMPLWSRA